MNEDQKDVVEFIVPVKVAIRVDPDFDLGVVVSYIHDHIDLVVKPDQSGPKPCSIMRAWLSWSHIKRNP
jgi:hypothetical protein